MSILKVSRMGHPILRAKAKALSPGDIKHAVVQNLIDDMLDTMDEYHGVGLAAPQVHEGLRIFVGVLASSRSEDPKDPDPEPVAIINPEIAALAAEVVEDWEGCLSIPDIRGRVPRAKEIRLRGYDREGKKVDLQLKDFHARVAQHETDHLDGILFFDRMRTFETLTFLDEYSRYQAKD